MAKQVAGSWKNRIVGHGEEPPDSLLAHPDNWRIHSKMQQDALAGVLDDVGWVQQVLVNQRSGHIVDGHLRVALALRRSEPTVPVLYVDLDEHEESLVLATLDPISAMAAADATKLDELLREVQSGDAAVQAMLAELSAQQPFGGTSTERDGQAVNSTWDQVKQTDNQKVVIGEIETRLPADVVEMLTSLLESEYQDNRKPIHETLEAVIVAGVRAVEAGGD